MNTYNIFNFRRFGKYFASDLRSCASNYGLSMLLISIMGVIVYAGTVLMGVIFNQTWEGPELAFRVVTFIISMFVLIVAMPPKCYGHVTDKKAGSSWLLVPASRLEKYLSMILMCVIVIPVISAAVYLCLDAIICAIDRTCGQSLISAAINLFRGFTDAKEEIAADILASGSLSSASLASLESFVDQISCPWLYVDDFIGMVLTFLLGAVFFKSGKTVKTFLALAALSTVVSIVASPLLMNWGFDMVRIVEAEHDLNDVFSMGIFRHVALYDTINDTIVNIALLLGIWFRLKTLKH